MVTNPELIAKFTLPTLFRVNLCMLLITILDSFSWFVVLWSHQACFHNRTITKKENPISCASMNTETNKSYMGQLRLFAQTHSVPLRWLIQFKVLTAKEFNNLWLNWHVSSCNLCCIKYHRRNPPWEQLTWSTMSTVTMRYCIKLVLLFIVLLVNTWLICVSYIFHCKV